MKKNYRPVSILTAISKLFERLLEGQLQLFQNSILHPSVSAFRPGHSCQSVLLKLTEDIRSELDRGQITGLALMDLSKAFDSIPHPLFISKLHAYGMTCSALNLITSYLIERKQRVKLRGCTSDWAPITKGVPQGSVLGPMFFNLFLNDILFALNEAVIYNYADDNILKATADDVNEVKKILINESVKAITWFEMNLMEANPDKFQFMLLGKSVIPEKESLKFSNVEIQCVTSVKLLGVTLDYKLNFNEHINFLAAKAGAQLSALSRVRRFLDVDSKLILVKTFILSHFRYCPIVWHFCGKLNANKLENIQKRALKLALDHSNEDYGQLLAKNIKEQCGFWRC